MEKVFFFLCYYKKKSSTPQLENTTPPPPPLKNKQKNPTEQTQKGKQATGVFNSIVKLNTGDPASPDGQGHRQDPTQPLAAGGLEKTDSSTRAGSATNTCQISPLLLPQTISFMLILH